MLNRIIRIAAAACALLFMAGCARVLDPVDNGGAIRFTAGSPLLRGYDATTKGGTPKTGTTFTVGDSFKAWAWHSATAQNLTFGGTTPVTLGAGGTWTYAPLQFWNWRAGEDYYDFLAVYPSNKDYTHPNATLQNTQLRASYEYDATDDQFDLMAAGLRRNDKSIGTVNLTFQHILSAVSVVVTNYASSSIPITLISCQFEELITSAPITMTFNGTTLTTNIGAGGRVSPALGPQIPAETDLNPGDSYPDGTLQWDLMVPQNLDNEGTQYLSPKITIEYSDDDGLTTQTVSAFLKDIKRTGTNDCITEWVAGYKYEYEIELRLGVGITVNVSTTPWELVEAETPGLMI